MVCDSKKLDNFIYTSGIKVVVVLFFVFFVLFIYKENSMNINPVPIKIQPRSFVKYVPQIEKESNENGKVNIIYYSE